MFPSPTWIVRNTLNSYSRSAVRSKSSRTDCGPLVASERRTTRIVDDEELTGWFSEVQSLERATLVKLMRLGGGVRKVLDARGRFKT